MGGGGGTVGNVINSVLGAGETAAGVASGNPMLALQGAGQTAQGIGSFFGSSPGQGNIAGPPSPGGASFLSQLGQGLGQGGSALSSGLNALSPFLGQGETKMQPAPVAHGGPPSPFQSSSPIQADGGNGSLMQLIQALMQSPR